MEDASTAVPTSTEPLPLPPAAVRAKGKKTSISNQTNECNVRNGQESEIYDFFHMPQFACIL